MSEEGRGLVRGFPERRGRTIGGEELEELKRPLGALTEAMNV
jgi:hypothetical protein